MINPLIVAEAEKLKAESEEAVAKWSKKTDKELTAVRDEQTILRVELRKQLEAIGARQVMAKLMRD